jgi:hypothetical protein
LKLFVHVVVVHIRLADIRSTSTVSSLYKSLVNAFIPP